MAARVPMSVAFAYGAADRSGAPEAARLAQGLDLASPPAIVDWGRAAWNPPAAFETYLDADRWAEAAPAGVAAGESADQTRVRAMEDAAYAARTAALAARYATELAAEAGPGGLSERGEAAAEPLASGAAEPLLAIPAWIRRLALRRVARDAAASYLTVSDAIHYVARGEAIRYAARADLLAWAATAPRPRVAIGLSLGGTILVDVLTALAAEGSRPAVDLLVTVGAQAPLLYWCDALSSLRPPGPAERGAARPFEPWLNVWNPDDLLSYQTRDTFVSGSIRDVTVSDPGAFPENHSHYFQNEAVFEAIREAVTQIREEAP